MNTLKRSTLFTPKLVWGLILIVLGLCLTLEQFGWWAVGDLLRFWPLGLAAIGLAHLWHKGFLSLGGHVWIAFALVASAAQFGREDLLERGWPIFIIWAGAIVTFRALRRPPPPTPVSCDPEDTPSERQP